MQISEAQNLKIDDVLHNTCDLDTLYRVVATAQTGVKLLQMNFSPQYAIWRGHNELDIYELDVRKTVQ